MTQAPLWSIFALDTSSLVRLDGLDRPPPYPTAYSPDERVKTWKGLEALADDGRLRLVKQVREELSRWHPTGLGRLSAFPGCRMPRTNNELRCRYQRLLASYPRMIPRDPARDPADPWLIVSAQQYGLTIITEELPRSARRSRARRGPPIPDVCDDLGIQWTSLRSLAMASSWIP